ncbi:MAG: glycoside hydrolase family 88 protein, partial [Xanthomonadales bacterium]|nr:glycoside hydrolase family 88 protein [Xanthomonadales bacterium]
FHAPQAPFHWARGNGWMAAGMTELLRNLPAEHPDHAEILAGYRRMMAALLATQGEDGRWRQLLDLPTAWEEGSGSAMFSYAFVVGVRRGWLPAETYGPAARKAWLSLVDSLDADARLRDVCVGTPTGSDAQHYLDRPRVDGDLHGQAPMLWTAAALLETLPVDQASE